MTDAGALAALPSFTDRISLREKVAHALRAAVVAGDMKPGEIYSAPALAARFGISATPVREAMLDLAKQGLVEPVRNKGFRVTEVSDEDLDQITEIRLLLEPPASAAAARVASPLEADRLRPLAQSIVDLADRGDLIGYLEADRGFHIALLTLAGNHRLVEIVSDLRAQTRLYGLSELAAKGVLGHLSQEHLQMCDLLAAGDPEGMRALVEQHIQHVRREWAGRLA